MRRRSPFLSTETRKFLRQHPSAYYPTKEELEGRKHEEVRKEKMKQWS